MMETPKSGNIHLYWVKGVASERFLSKRTDISSWDFVKSRSREIYPRIFSIAMEIGSLQGITTAMSSVKFQSDVS